MIAGFGLDRVIARHLVECPTESGEIIRRAFFVKLFFAAAGYVAMIAILVAIDYHERLTLWIATLAGGSLLFQCCDVYEFVFQAQNRFQRIFLGRGVPLLICAGIKIAAIFGGASLLMIAGLETLEAAFVGGTLLMIYRAQPLSKASCIDKPAPATSRLLAEGFPLLLGALFRSHLHAHRFAHAGRDQRLHVGWNLRRRLANYRGMRARADGFLAGPLSDAGPMAYLGRGHVKSRIPKVCSSGVRLRLSGSQPF